MIGGLAMGLSALIGLFLKETNPLAEQHHLSSSTGPAYEARRG
jgi:hypothetical protein